MQTTQNGLKKRKMHNIGDIIGINLKTGKARKYRAGDRVIGIYSKNPVYVGNFK